MLWLAAANVILWSLLPLAVEGSLRLDAAEGQIGGAFWMLSYAKHPPIWQWLIAASKLTGEFRYFTVYFAGQLCAVGAFCFLAWGVWREYGALPAALTMALGLVSPFASYVPIQVNPNIVLMPFWAVTLWAGYWAFEGGKLKHWMLFGISVGLAIWAKYAILHLVLPLGVLFLCVPTYRAQLWTPRPWIAALAAFALVVPHAVSVASDNFESLHYATRTFATSATEKLGLSGNFLMNAVILNAIMALICGATFGFRPIWAAVRKGLSCHASRMDVYLHVAAFGPVLVVIASPLFDARPRALWITPFVLGFALWWTHFTANSGAQSKVWRLRPVTIAGMGLFLAGYLLARLTGPAVTGLAGYPEMDGRALAHLAETAWQTYDKGPIPYLIGLPDQRGRHAVGSIAFNLPYRLAAIDDIFRTTPAWVDLEDLSRRGALVVAIGDLPQDLQFLSTTVIPAGKFIRPTLRGVTRKRFVSFGILPKRTAPLPAADQMLLAERSLRPYWQQAHY